MVFPPKKVCVSRQVQLVPFCETVILRFQKVTISDTGISDYPTTKNPKCAAVLNESCWFSMLTLHALSTTDVFVSSPGPLPPGLATQSLLAVSRGECHGGLARSGIYEAGEGRRRVGGVGVGGNAAGGEQARGWARRLSQEGTLSEWSITYFVLLRE